MTCNILLFRVYLIFCHVNLYHPVPPTFAVILTLSNFNIVLGLEKQQDADTDTDTNTVKVRYASSIFPQYRQRWVDSIHRFHTSIPYISCGKSLGLGLGLGPGLLLTRSVKLMIDRFGAGECTYRDSILSGHKPQQTFISFKSRYPADLPCDVRYFLLVCVTLSHCHTVTPLH